MGHSISWYGTFYLLVWNIWTFSKTFQSGSPRSWFMTFLFGFVTEFKCPLCKHEWNYPSDKVTTPLKRLTSFPPAFTSSQQHLREGENSISPFPIYDWLLPGSVWFRPSADNCDFTISMTVSYPEDYFTTVL